MFNRFRQRSYEPEHLDVGDYTPEEYQGCLRELQRVNRFLGDERALRAALFDEMARLSQRSISVLDVGAGSGHLLRVIVRWGRAHGKRVRAVGVELNARAARAIADESRCFEEIAAVRADARSLPFGDGAFDYAISSLFLHHFCEAEIIHLLNEMARVARCVVAIDLQRHWLAYYAYVTIGPFFLHNRLVREDGALSIRRGFRRDELLSLARASQLEQVAVRARFPFRLVLRASKENAK
ncbi:MAG: hypothetical protein C4334_11160 [Pyrinomonas sp.]|uniref:methyltransferase domain-containing protein n=1 Tax=Pyrinomonas sp. TaxID=2080306 RepID=UPI00331EEF22